MSLFNRITAHRAKTLTIMGTIAGWIWTGQTYVWNPFWTIGYTYYPLVIFISAGVLGQLFRKEKHAEKPDLEQKPFQSTRNLIRKLRQRKQSEVAPVPPLESLRDDDEV